MESTIDFEGAVSGNLDLSSLTRRRRKRPAQSPDAWARLTQRVRRTARQFAGLVLLALVFGISAGAVQIVEHVTPLRGDPALIAGAAKGPDRETRQLVSKRKVDGARSPADDVQRNHVRQLMI